MFFRVWYQAKWPVNSWILFIPALEVSEALSVPVDGCVPGKGSVNITACLFHVFVVIHQGILGATPYLFVK